MADCVETFLQRDALHLLIVFSLPEADASGLPPKSGLAGSLGKKPGKAPKRGTDTQQASGLDALSFCLAVLIVLSWDCSLQLTSQLPPMARLEKNASDLRRRREK